MEQIRSVAAESWANAYAGIIPPETQNRALAAWYDTEAIKSAMAEDGAVFLVALAHGVVVGFIHLGPPQAGTVELLRMYVLPRNARQGVGTRLLEAGVSAYESHDAQISVAVAERNSSGRAFYEKSGFVLTGTRTVDVFGASIAEVTYIRNLEGGAA
ncbi:MAG TPA: GNAT family N-acetyltransferase [Rhodothermales bacterium]|nr:GNAT family N-acetyltransferase [Rhodothermales bacterium]